MWGRTEETSRRLRGAAGTVAARTGWQLVRFVLRFAKHAWKKTTDTVMTALLVFAALWLLAEISEVRTSDVAASLDAQPFLANPEYSAEVMPGTLFSLNDEGELRPICFLQINDVDLERTEETYRTYSMLVHNEWFLGRLVSWILGALDAGFPTEQVYTLSLSVLPAGQRPLINPACEKEVEMAVRSSTEMAVVAYSVLSLDDSGKHPKTFVRLSNQAVVPVGTSKPLLVPPPGFPFRFATAVGLIRTERLDR